jgi:hypothetical protein
MIIRIKVKAVAMDERGREQEIFLWPSTECHELVRALTPSKTERSYAGNVKFDSTMSFSFLAEGCIRLRAGGARRRTACDRGTAASPEDVRKT